MESLAYQVTLTTTSCGECGGVYAINERVRASHAQKGTGWNCPYCKCGWGYFSSGENKRLKRELDEAKQATERERKRKEWAQQEARNAEKRASAQKGLVTRIRNRVGNGVCPCCNRTFQDLQRHMHSQHPEYTAKDSA